MKSRSNLFSTLKDRNLRNWIRPFVRDRVVNALELRMAKRDPKLRHMLFAICDHYEPLWGQASELEGAHRVERWVNGYPRQLSSFRDADGFPPRHSFFFPGEQYRAIFFDGLAALARSHYGEVELHLHHDGDTESHLRSEIMRYLDQFASHGFLSREPDGVLRYGFIHGNWCLANARKDGRWCGVDNELTLLHETGCYADFTFPSAPDESQPRIINRIYWPIGDLSRRRAYEFGEAARAGRTYYDRILMVEGPLSLEPRHHRIPVRIENGHIAGGDPPTADRVRSWAKCNIHIEGRPEWVFVKVCMHGAPEKTAIPFLDCDARGLHETLQSHYNDGKEWALHYVTAREMVNIAFAAMDGQVGDPNRYRNYRLLAPPIAPKPPTNPAPPPTR